MRAVKFILVLCLLYGLYWLGAGIWMQRGIASWFDTQEARGWQAEFAGMSLGGFPGRHQTTLSAPALADPATGAAWQADALVIDSRAIWPGHVTLRFADAPQRLSYFDQTLALDTRTMVADLRLRPGLALQLEHMSLISGPWSLTAEAGGLVAADTLVVSASQQETPAQYTLRLDAQSFTPGDRLLELARISRTLPESFETLELRADITFDKPWDLSALETARPQPRFVDLELAEIHWGALRLLAAGDFTVDDEGIPEGVITIKAENWRDMISLARQAGVLPEAAVDPLERTLSLLEGLGGNRNALDLQLNLRGGAVALGPLPLGPAPRLIIR